MLKTYKYMLLATLAISLTACGESKLDQVKQDSLKNFIFVKGGTFTMGDFGVDMEGKHYRITLGKGKEPHEVTLNSYSLGKYQVTWFDYDTFLLATNRPVQGIGIPDENSGLAWFKNRSPYMKSIDDSYASKTFYYTKPASVNWQDAKDYCQWLGKELNLPIDLVTEAQWEYAGRDRGKKVIFANATSTQSNPPTYYDYSNPIKRLSSFSQYKPIGTYSTPNGLGFYDMDNNGLEWVNDWYSETYYSEYPKITDPQGPTSGERKTLRSWETVIGRNGAGPKAFETFRCAVNSSTPVNK